MAHRELTIINKLGLHARAASKLAKTTAAFACTIRLSRNGKTVDGKNLMGIMMLAAAKDSVITVETDGPDADAAMDAIATLVADRFGEGE